MEGRLPPVHFGASVVHRRDDRPEGEAKTLAVLAAFSHDRNGRVYILMITAFYVDNGPNLPLWRELPPLAFWTLPTLIGAPILINALLRHPLVRNHR